MIWGWCLNVQIKKMKMPVCGQGKACLSWGFTVNSGIDKDTGAMRQKAVIKKVVKGLYKMSF
jgi:hypothetical protein